MNLHQKQPGRMVNANENYESLYRKHKKIFVKSGLLSVVFLLVLAFALDFAITRWLTIKDFFDFQVMLMMGLAVVSLIGLIKNVPAMVKAQMESRDESIRRVLECKKILNSYRAQLASVSYDIISLERLTEDGTAPPQLERIIRDALAVRMAEKAPKKSPAPRPVQTERAQEVQETQSQKIDKEAILLLLREKEHEIRNRVRRGTLNKREANVLLESVRLEARKKLQGVQ